MTVQSRKTLPRRALAAMAVVAASFSLTAWSIYDSHRSTCDGRRITLQVMRDLIMSARTVRAEEAATPDQRAAAYGFYAKALARIDQAEC